MPCETPPLEENPGAAFFVSTQSHSSPRCYSHRLMKKYTLKRPFKSANGVQITEIEIREPETNDLFSVAERGGNETVQSLTLLRSICTNITPEDFGRLKFVDLQGVGVAAKDFLQLPELPPSQI